MRPMLECIELLKYLRDNPQRVDEVLEDRLPSAGEIGKRTHGSFKQLRKYLNEHASHLSFTPESMLHLIDFKSGNWKTTQPLNEKVLRKNMSTLFSLLVYLLFEAANCLAYGELLSDSLKDCLNAFRDRGLEIFGDIPHE